MNRKEIVCFDLDNCLTDELWRHRLINWGATNLDVRYGAYHYACDRDEPGNVETFRCISQLATPVFLTARPECVRALTEEWLYRKLGVVSPRVLMRRAQGDFRSTPLLKGAMVGHLQGDGHRIIAAFDDREDAVEMYRAFGIPAAVLAVHPGQGGHINPKTMEVTA